MSTTTTDSIALSSDLGHTAWYAEVTSSPAATTPAATARRREPRVLAALSDLIHSYHRPAYMTDERGEMVCMNAAAGRLFDESGDEGGLETAASVQVGERSFKLFVPPPVEAESDEPVQETHLPPRLLRIARLVVSGCTDKQISAQTGLSFSTVRTYVRQIYRRVGVHNRVELVHRTNAGGVPL